MYRYLKVFGLLFLVSLIILLVLKWTAVKNFWFRMTRPKEAPSMIRALPFDILREREKSRLPRLEKQLTPTQILIPNVIALPKDAPLGEVLRVSVVLEATDQETARYLDGRRGELATLVLETIREFPYRDLNRPEAFQKFKKALEHRIFFYYGDKIRSLSIVEFEWRKAPT